MKSAKFNKILFSLPFKIIISIIAFWNPFNFYLYQDFHYFLDANSFKGAQYLIAFLMVACSFFVLVTEWIKFSGKTDFKKPYKIIYFICLVFTILSLIVNLVFDVALSSATQMFRKNFINMAPFFGVTLGVILVSFLATIINRKKLLASIIAFLLICEFVCVGIFSFRLFVFKFTSNPVVFDEGNNYIISWATNDKSIGKLEYTYNNEKYILFDEYAGRINSTEIIHSIKVPKEHLINNSYKVSSTRMYSNVAYAPISGETISIERKFKGQVIGDINLTIITDTHNVAEYCFDVVKNEKTDVLVMLGDFCDYISDDNAIADYLLRPCSKITNGETPVIYAKGNHDNRGESSTKLMTLLKFDSFYYQTSINNYDFTILDSGECDVDSYPEYGNTANFAKYREKQSTWLESIVKDDTKNNILIVHNPVYEINDELIGKFNTDCQIFDFDLQLSGHTHKWSYSENGYKDKITAQPVFVSAGVVGDFIKKDLNYSTLVLSDNKITINCKSYSKGLINTYSLNI